MMPNTNLRDNPPLSAKALKELHEAAERGWISTATLDEICDGCDGGPGCPDADEDDEE
jgi:hypothetical protein